MKEAEAPRPAAASQTVQKMKDGSGSSACTHAADCFLLAWTAGLLLAFLNTERFVLPLTGLLAGSGCFLLRGRLCGYVRAVIAALCGLLLGICVWNVYDAAVRRPLLAMDGQTAEICGSVTAAVPLAGDRMIYTLRTEIGGIRTTADWYAPADAPHLEPGDSVTLNAELTRITQDYRSHTADYQAGMGKYLRIYRAEVRGCEANVGFSLRRVFSDYRAYLTELIASRLGETESGLLCAMLFGDKTALSDDVSDALYRSGIGHIAAVSGLHLVFFCALIAWILRRLTASPKTVLAGCIVGIAAFILLVDSSVSVYRAAVMVTLHLAAPMFGRRSDSLRSLGIAMLLCTAFTPYVIGSVSFWLSVSGVFGIAIAAPYLNKRLDLTGFPAHILSLVTVSAAVFPASLLLTGESSLIAPVCNLIILPLAAAALYLGLILVCTGGLTAFLLPAAGFLCRCTVQTAQAAAAVPFSHIGAAFPAVRVILIAGAVITLLLFALHSAPKTICSAVLCTGLLMSLASLAQTFMQRNTLRIAVLGQRNECVLVLTEGGFTAAADMTGAVRDPAYVQRFLRDSGISRIDVLLLPDAGNAAAYQQTFGAHTVKDLHISQTDPWRENLTVCGVTPFFAGDAVQEIRFADTLLRYDGKTAEITHGDTHILALPADADSAAADAVIRFGKKDASAADSCALRLVPKQDGNNQLLTVSGGAITRTAL